MTRYFRFRQEKPNQEGEVWVFPTSDRSAGSGILGAVLQAADLGKRYGARWIFRGLEFQVAAGQCLAVVGRNGIGKSTLLKVVVGLVAPSHGRVSCHRDIGYAAIDLALYPQLTAREHLDFAARLRGVNSHTDKLLTDVGLTDASDVATGLFSTGMRARLKLALALQHSPGLLVLDEPTAALDETGRVLVESTLARHIAEGGAALIATNDANDRRMATHVIELD